MSASADIANFQMSTPFLVWRKHSFKPGHSLNFSSVKRGAYSKGAFILAEMLFQIVTVFTREVCDFFKKIVSEYL